MNVIRNVLSLASIVWLTAAFSSCCEDGTARISEQPRFSPQDVAVPGPRGHYPPSFAQAVQARVTHCQTAWNTGYAGMDMEFTYGPVGGMKPSYRIFQLVTGRTDYFGTNQNECGDLDGTENPIILEYWRPERAKADVLAINYCTEKRIVSNIRGIVAIIDLDDLDDETVRQINSEAVRQELISPGENVVMLSPTTTHQPLTPQQFRYVREKIESCIAIEWQMHYEYDGCSADPVDPNDPPNTFCGQIHCLGLSWKDDNGTHNPAVFMSN